MSKILLLGGGGHCMSVLDSLLGLNIYDRIGIVDRDWRHKPPLLGVPYVGSDLDLEDLYDQGYQDAFVTVGSIGNPQVRIRLWELARNLGFRLPNIIDQTAAVSVYVDLGAGIYMGKRAVVNAGCRIGNAVIINTGAVVEHEAVLEDYVHVAPGSCICGNVTLKEQVHIGAGSVVKQGITVHRAAIIGIGSVVTQEVAEQAVAYGNPCCARHISQKER